MIIRYLENDSKVLLEQIILDMPEKDCAEPILWAIKIPYENPLTFRLNNDRGYKLHVDLTCDIQGIVERHDSEITKFTTYNVELRVWSHEKRLSFREDLDSTELHDSLKDNDWQRVVLRFHMDKRAHQPENPEPIYHLHAGGDSKRGEFCSIPKEIHVPRFYHYPMDIILLIEFILTNFFPTQTRGLRNKPEWKALIRDVQTFYLEYYINELKSFLANENDTLLGHLVSN